MTFQGHTRTLETPSRLTKTYRINFRKKTSLSSFDFVLDSMISPNGICNVRRKHKFLVQ